MKYRVRLTEKAESDIEGVLRWFREHSADIAGGRWFAQLMRRIASLESFPDRCAMAAEAPNIGVEVRELLMGKRAGKYRILFNIHDHTVYILRVWRGARDVFTANDL